MVESSRCATMVDSVEVSVLNQNSTEKSDEPIVGGSVRRISSSVPSNRIALVGPSRAESGAWLVRRVTPLAVASFEPDAPSLTTLEARLFML